MSKPQRHIWDESSVDRSVAGDFYDAVWDYAEQLEAENERLKSQLSLYIQRVSFEVACRLADKGEDYSMPVYMLRDLPLTKDANLLDLAWALAMPDSGYCSKGDWEGFYEVWDDAWRKAYNALKEGE